MEVCRTIIKQTICNQQQTTLSFYNDILHIVYFNCCIQQEEDSFYQQIGLKFEEETNKMLHLEHGFVRC